MKRAALLLLPLLLLAAMGAAKWRLDNPPLTDSDRRLRRLAAQADEIVIQTPGKINFVYYEPLRGPEIAQFVNFLRVSDSATIENLRGSFGRWYSIGFLRQHKSLGGFKLWSSPMSASAGVDGSIFNPQPAHSVFSSDCPGLCCGPRYHVSFWSARRVMRFLAARPFTPPENSLFQ